MKALLSNKKELSGNIRKQLIEVLIEQSTKQSRSEQAEILASGSGGGSREKELESPIPSSRQARSSSPPVKIQSSIKVMADPEEDVKDTKSECLNQSCDGEGG